MTEKKRPNVVGKGPSLISEMSVIFNEIGEDLGNFSDQAADKVKLLIAEQGQTVETLRKAAYVKTVKAGEVAWDLKEMALSLKDAVKAGDEAKATELVAKMESELDWFINKIKTFVVRMT